MIHILPLPPPEPANGGLRIGLEILLVTCGVPLLVVAAVVPLITMAWLVRSLLPVAP